MNKGVIIYNLEKLGYSTNICKKIKGEEDLLVLGQKDENILKIIFYVNGLLKVDLKNCWKTLERETQIEKLTHVSSLLKHDQYRRKALINFHAKKGICNPKELNEFLVQHNEPEVDCPTEFYYTQKATKAIEYISSLT